MFDFADEIEMPEIAGLPPPIPEIWLEEPVCLRGGRWQGRYFWEVDPVLRYITKWGRADFRWQRVYSALYDHGLVALVSDSTGNFLATLSAQFKAVAEVIGLVVGGCLDEWIDRATALSNAVRSGSFQVIVTVSDSDAYFVLHNPPVFPSLEVQHCHQQVVQY